MTPPPRSRPGSGPAGSASSANSHRSSQPHKGRCGRALDQWLRSQYPLEDHWISLWEEIDVFLKQLGNNASRSFADDKRGEYHELIVEMPRRSADWHAATRAQTRTHPKRLGRIFAVAPPERGPPDCAAAMPHTVL
ncbi:hypothetical protein GCM10014715_07530 [Streptomyces spiralis]|uniref:Uncharacterized protein n=1 Tax=Streptomyces spiralis TaxID=66376 RepID=A0A918ZL38_9ACTN|nr:hypothetical protein GCM10014715_07530 [Streptomyces spiralis]